MSSFTPSEKLVCVSLATGELPIIITLLDDRLSVIATGLGSLSTEVRPGIYKYRLSIGEAEQEAFIQVGHEGVTMLDLDEKLDFRFSMPLPSSSRGRLIHGVLSMLPLGHAIPEGRIALVINDSDEGGPVALPTWTCKLFDAEFNELEFDREDWTEDAGHRIAVWATNLKPGGYILRWFREDPDQNERIKEGFRHLDQSIWISNRWTTFVFTEFDRETKRIRKSRSLISFFRMEFGYAFEDEFILRTETASRVVLAGLQRGHVQLGGDLLQFLLNAKFNNPMLGIMACHALFYRKTKANDLLMTVLDNMFHEMSDNPDILAIQLHLSNEKQAARIGGAEWPPMLYASYELLLDDDWASKGQAIKPDSKADTALTTLLGQGPWTMWLTPEGEAEEGIERELQLNLDALANLNVTLSQEKDVETMRFAPTERHAAADKRVELRVAQYLNRAGAELEKGVRGQISLDDDEYRAELARNIGLPMSSVDRAIDAVMTKKKRRG